MNIPCPNKSNFCPCTDNPLANLSSEAPDRNLFTRIDYFSYLGPAPIVLCEDELADLANCPHSCDPNVDTCPCDPATTCCDPAGCDPDQCKNPPCIPPPVIYHSQETSCTQCEVSYTLPAGVVTSSISQADADARAQSICQSRVNALAADSHACETNPPQPTCTPAPGGFGYGQLSPVTAGVGENLSLSVSFVYAGSRPLTFLWYKDGIPFQTGSPVGAFVFLSIPNLTAGDAGVYRLGIKPLGCPEVFSNNIEVLIVPCNCGTPGEVPLNLLEVDGTVMVDYTAGGILAPSVNFFITDGRFVLKYISGYALECEHNGHNIGDCATSAFRSICSLDADVRVDYNGDLVLELLLADVTFGDDISEIGNIPANTCQNGRALGAAQVALFPGTYPGNEVPALQDLLPVVGSPTFLARLNCAPLVFPLWPLSTICGGQNGETGDCTDGAPACPATNDTRFQVIRTHKFRDRPFPLSIKDFATVWSMIVPPGGSTDPDYPDQWLGVFDEEPSVASLITLNYRINSVPWGVDGFAVNTSLVNCALGPVGFWQLTITATWHDPAGHNEVLWRGRKYTGVNAAGSYCYFSSFNPAIDVPTCVILEE